MRKPTMMALAILLFGSSLLSGCYVGPWWWDHDEGEHWEHHRGGGERRGALTPQDGRWRTDGNARHGDDVGNG